MASHWSEAERALLDAILDRVIPPNPARDVPAAGGLGVAEFLGRKAASDPDFAARIRALLAKVSGPADTVTADTVDHLQAALPEAFDLLLRWTYMGYYSRPDIRPLVGLSPLPTQPRGYDVPPESPEEMAALVGPVKARGRCYRKA